MRQLIKDLWDAGLIEFAVLLIAYLALCIAVVSHFGALIVIKKCVGQ